MVGSPISGQLSLGSIRSWLSKPESSSGVSALDCASRFLRWFPSIMNLGAKGTLPFPSCSGQSSVTAAEKPTGTLFIRVADSL